MARPEAARPVRRAPRCILLTGFEPFGGESINPSGEIARQLHGTVIGGVVIDGGSFDWERSGKFAELTAPYEGFHNMVFTEESTIGAFLLRARREGLRDFGACMSPHTAWLILQGIETLPLRMARHMSNTEKVVEFLAAHPLVSRVGHPMLESHPSHALAQKLLPRGAGSVFSFDLKGSREQGKKFVETLKSLKGKTTVLFISHRPSHILLADTLLVFDKGYLRAAGPPTELLKRPAAA